MSFLSNFLAFGLHSGHKNEKKPTMAAANLRVAAKGQMVTAPATLAVITDDRSAFCCSLKPMFGRSVVHVQFIHMLRPTSSLQVMFYSMEGGWSNEWRLEGNVDGMMARMVEAIEVLPCHFALCTYLCVKGSPDAFIVG